MFAGRAEVERFFGLFPASSTLHPHDRERRREVEADQRIILDNEHDKLLRHSDANPGELIAVAKGSALSVRCGPLLIPPKLNRQV